jgi:hypothetical protein
MGSVEPGLVLFECHAGDTRMRRLEREFVATPLYSEHTLIQALLLIAVPVPTTPVNRRTTLLDSNSPLAGIYLPGVIYW